METQNIYLENLCSCAEFEKMTQTERKNYIDKTFYHGAPFKVLAKIADFNETLIHIRVTHFLTADNRAVKFQLCHDDFSSALSKLGATGFYDKMPRDSVAKFCSENNLHSGDEVVCILVVQDSPKQIEKGNLLTFLVKSLDNNLTDLEKIYSKYSIAYAPNQLYELRENDNRELKIFLQDNLNSEIEKILVDGDKAIQEQQKILSDLQTRSTELDKQIKIKQASYDNLKKIFAEKYKSEEEKMQAKLNYLQTFDVDLSNTIFSVFDTEMTAFLDSALLEEFDNFEEMLEYWQKYLQEVHGLIYGKEILKSLYFGLQTDKLILLTGNPGTGKTSLVKALSKSFAFEDAAIISVQSNWTEKGDLLGYYNPIEKNYIATEFLDALIKFCRLAESVPNKLFVICLDEMNLAHVEHYFAEFLSSLQDNREIILYSEKMRENIIHELQANGQNEDSEFDKEKISTLNIEERKYYFELCRMARMIVDYPAKIKIPQNVKFFGTLNQDETTHDISPKVIDRSYIIRLEKNNLQLENIEGDYSPIYYKKLEEFQPTHEEILNIDDFEKILNAVANISKRVTKEVVRNENFETWTKILGVNDIEDFIIASFLLPKIRFDEDEYKEKIDALKNLCEGYKLSEEILKQIDDGKEADFWRR